MVSRDVMITVACMYRFMLFPFITLFVVD
jgi:hypothetical protein